MMSHETKNEEGDPVIGIQVEMKDPKIGILKLKVGTSWWGYPKRENSGPWYFENWKWKGESYDRYP